MSAETKKCTKCGEVKQAEEFMRNGDGRRSICRKCQSLVSAAFYAKNANNEKARYSKYHEANAEKINERRRARRNADAEHTRIAAAKYRASRREADRVRAVLYRKKNPESIKATNHKTVANLSSSYIADLLNIPVSECPDILIEAKREQVQIKRLAKEFKRTVKEVFK